MENQFWINIFSGNIWLWSMALKMGLCFVIFVQTKCSLLEKDLWRIIWETSTTKNESYLIFIMTTYSTSDHYCQKKVFSNKTFESAKWSLCQKNFWYTTGNLWAYNVQLCSIKTTLLGVLLICNWLCGKQIVWVNKNGNQSLLILENISWNF